jgi:hypothetical protein
MGTPDCLEHVHLCTPKTAADYRARRHPRFASAVAVMAESALAEPDYRPRVTGDDVDSLPHHTQTDGLPVAVLETLHAQLALLEPRMEEAALRGEVTAAALAGRVLRYAAVLRPIAVDLAARAAEWATAAGLPRPAWLDRYDSLTGKSASLMGRLASLAGAILAGENPLGISDEDLPLYFFGDEVTATRRFSAVSDFLIGAGPGSTAWAPTLVARADAELDAARTAYISIRQREVQTAQDEATLARRLDRIRTKYGDQIFELCGVPPEGEGRTIDILEHWPEWTDGRPFSEHACYIRVDNPSCNVDLDEYARTLTLDQMKYQLCLVREVRKRVGGIVSFGSFDLDQLTTLDYCLDMNFPVECPADVGGGFRCIYCERPSPAPPEYTPVSPDTFRRLGGMEFVPSRVVEDARTACNSLFPEVDPLLPSPDDIPGRSASPLDCWDGSIGAIVMTIRSAQQDLEVARSEFDDLGRAYDINAQLCTDLVTDRALVVEGRRLHNIAISNLRDQKLTVDSVAEAASAAKWASEALDVGTPIPWVAGAAAIAGVLAAVTEGVAAVEGLKLQEKMDSTVQAFEAWVAEIEAGMENRQCLADAKMAMVGLESATLRITAAAMDIENAYYDFKEAKAAAAQAYNDGRLALQTLQGRAVAPLDHDLWLDEHIDSFLHDMRLARRLVFLAVRAVEYESQQSLPLGYDTLSAARPSQLQEVLDELWTTAATRGVGGARPTDLKVVLSLREHLLQLADHSGLPPEELTLSDVERFRLLIQSPRYAEFDAAGTYLGQRIPFDLAPLGTMGLGDPQGIPVLAATDCAERVWSVNASVLGTADMWRGTSPPTFTRVDLLKENTFYSQWCSPGDQPFQTASVRPAHNLFRDPVVGGEYGTSLGPGSESTLFTRARIEAYFNVPREQFEADSYANGETSELAARGLYGRYALFIPADVLAVGESSGLVLNEVDDILLRLDYVSVAR